MMDTDFQKVLHFIETETGISLPDTNFRNTRSFLSDRLAKLELNAGEYLERLGRDQAEYEDFINVITINETYFFREEKHFSILDRELLPEICRENPEHLNIWSAACSTGEEAVSLAAVLHKHRSRLPAGRHTLYASDINPRAIAILRRGQYGPHSFRRDGTALHSLLEPLGEREGDFWSLKSEFLKAMQIRQLNLHVEPYTSLPSVFHIIFLRNTLLYMKIETRLTIIDRMCRRLKVGGYLFLSMSETALITHPELELIKAGTIYYFRKKKPPAGPGRRREVKPAVQKAPAVSPPARPPHKASGLSLEKLFALVNGQEQDFGELSDPGLPYRAADLLKASMAQINAGTHDQARATLRRLEQLIQPNEVIHYLVGYLAMSAGKHNEAVACFRKALGVKNSFWLARFYLAKLLSHQSPHQAKREFLICHTHIEQYLEQQTADYQFLLEGFNARYFQSICNSWLADYNREE